MRVIYSILILVLIFSCKKETFNHQETYIHYPCKCRLTTDSVAGTYTGHYVEAVALNSPPNVQYDTLLDTIVSITLVKVPYGGNFITDSLYCKFMASGFINGEVIFKEEDMNFTPKYFNTNRIETNGDLFLSTGNVVYYTQYLTYLQSFKRFTGIKQ